MPSRRRTLAAIGSTAALALPGCVVYGGDDGEEKASENERKPMSERRPLNLTIGEAEGDEDSGASDGISPPPTFPTEGPLEARLVGPDAEYHFFDRSSIADVGEVSTARNVPSVPVTLSEERASAFTEAIQDADLEENHEQYEIVLTVDGEVVRESGITASLAEVWASGEWERQVMIQSPTEAEAQRLREALVDES